MPGRNFLVFLPAFVVPLSDRRLETIGRLEVEAVGLPERRRDSPVEGNRGSLLESEM